EPGAGPEPSGLPLFGQPVRGHVRARLPAVEHLLDRLLRNAVAVESWSDAVDLSLAHPDLVVVTPDGDRFAATGWRTGAAGSGATGAALDEARRRVEDAAAAVEATRTATAEA